uniref:Uncharacterized protein n=1 Tax=Romanomermis culicivorax TaxID=13658 RepID=A0A915JUP3_ROMCU
MKEKYAEKRKNSTAVDLAAGLTRSGRKYCRGLSVGGADEGSDCDVAEAEIVVDVETSEDEVGAVEETVADEGTLEGEHIGPQHQLLLIDIQLDLGQKWILRTTTAKKIKSWHLCERKAQLTAGLDMIDMDHNQQAIAIWEDAASQIHQVAHDVLGETRLGKKFIDKQIWWWNEEVQVAVKEKKLALKAWHHSHTDGDYQQYKNLKSAHEHCITQLPFYFIWSQITFVHRKTKSRQLIQYVVDFIKLRL